MSVHFLERWVKIVVCGILMIYMYGGMLIKCVAASLSFDEAFSFLIFGKTEELSNRIGFDFYYISIIVFACIATYFGLKNIESTKLLQIIIIFLRVFSVFLMIIGCIYSIAINGFADWNSPHFKKFDFSEMHFVLGNTIFVGMFQTCLPGIFYPLRPQSKTRKTMLCSLIATTSLLTIEGVLAMMAFGSLTSDPDDKNPCNNFPCPIQVYI